MSEKPKVLSEEEVKEMRDCFLGRGAEYQDRRDLKLALANLLASHESLRRERDALKARLALEEKLAGVLAEIIHDTGPGEYCEDYEEVPNAEWDDVIQGPCGKCKWCRARKLLTAFQKGGE